MSLGSAIAGVAAAVLACAAFATTAQATEYKVRWSNGDGAFAVGYFNIDTSIYPSGFPSAGPAGIGGVLSVTVSGASVGDGVFGASDFSSFSFWTPAPLDLTTELIGQSVGHGYTFGEPGAGPNGGDFNLFKATPSAPTGVNYFTLSTDGGDGNTLRVTSIAPVTGVPEPATWAMLILGVGMIGFAARRRSLGAALAA